MNVSAIIVTRGDVDLQPVIDSIPQGWEIVIWDNGENRVSRSDGFAEVATDLSVYGRYAAIEYASHELIYVQDDDVIVSDPQAIVNALLEAPCSVCDGSGRQLDAIATEDELARDPQADPPACPACKMWGTAYAAGELVANMPQEFRHDGYTDSCLVGFGACFHRDAPERAFSRMASANLDIAAIMAGSRGEAEQDFWRRTCDVVFTTLTPRVLVDVPKVDREFASDPNRMWKQPNHVGERTRMLELARQVRDS